MLAYQFVLLRIVVTLSICSSSTIPSYIIMASYSLAAVVFLTFIKHIKYIMQTIRTIKEQTDAITDIKHTQFSENKILPCPTFKSLLINN